MRINQSSHPSPIAARLPMNLSFQGRGSEGGLEHGRIDDCHRVCRRACGGIVSGAFGVWLAPLRFPAGRRALARPLLSFPPVAAACGAGPKGAVGEALDDHLVGVVLQDPSDLAEALAHLLEEAAGVDELNLAPAFSVSSAVRRAVSGSMSLTTTLAPALASRNAMDLPRPRPAPVTTTVLLERRQPEPASATATP